MGTPGEQVMPWTPRGVCDTILGDRAKPGAMASLQNLIHDPGTPGCVVCRPANTLEVDFTTWSGSVPNGTAGVITAAYQVGNIIYGMVSILTGTFAGYDYPFAYDHATAAFLPITGTITTGTLPASQATTGAWVPPQMTLTGIDLVITHVGFAGGGVYIGWMDLTTPTAPVWHAGDTATNSIGAVAQACGTFNNRTYIITGNIAWYTDTLAISMTNANQSLSIGDYTPITCLAPLPQSTTSLGITQGLLAFKLNTITLITGDAVTMNLGENQISSSVGTGAPRSAVSTPIGVKFMANDGIRLINFWAQLSEPDEDLAVPFINAQYPSRVAACFNSDIYRICVQNEIVIGTPYQDYWYDLKRQAWSGPHSFQYDIAVPISNDFILASNALPKQLWYSYSVQGHQNAGNTFVENGVQLLFIYGTPPMDELHNLYANALLRSTIEIAAASSGQTYTFTAQDESGTVLTTGSIMFVNNQISWGYFIWGVGVWGAAQSGLKPINIPWISSAVFNRLSVQITGVSSLGVKLGSLLTGYKKLKYLLN